MYEGNVTGRIDIQRIGCRGVRRDLPRYCSARHIGIVEFRFVNDGALIQLVFRYGVELYIVMSRAIVQALQQVKRIAIETYRIQVEIATEMDGLSQLSHLRT